jgi:drug/metabolite transporter (DMT)-like permease
MSKNDEYPNPREEDIYAGDRRVSRPDSALPDWHIPDAKYRPIPIAWFAAAFLVQMVALFVIFIVLSTQNGWITIALSSLVTGAIGMWTWDRGMREAGSGWQIATILMLVAQLAYICLGASARI